MPADSLTSELAALGISAEHISACRLPAYTEATILVDAGPDMFNRPALMTPETLDAWQAMRERAAADGIELKLVSAYRSVAYQCDLIRKKLAEGRSIEDILSVNALPGHSEHHTGCALDLHAGEGEPLTPAFEMEPAFAWLTECAAAFDFHLSYPRGNEEGIAYEPWHWCCHRQAVS